jgi:hypothetical protein
VDFSGVITLSVCDQIQILEVAILLISDWLF